MKLNKPLYDSSNKIYISEIIDGFRYSAKKEDKEFTPSLPEDFNENLTNMVIQLTKGWFSKPLTQEWLLQHIEYSIPTNDVEESFEGSLEWQMVKLSISKEKFTFDFKLISKIPDEKVIISLEDDEESNIPLTDSKGELAIGPTRRIIHKEEVMKARTRAARALFRAERMIQEYIQIYGDDTDWEDEGDESE